MNTKNTCTKFVLVFSNRTGEGNQFGRHKGRYATTRWFQSYGGLGTCEDIQLATWFDREESARYWLDKFPYLDLHEVTIGLLHID